MQKKLVLTALALAGLTAPALAGPDVQVIVKFKGTASAAAVRAKGGEVLGGVTGQEAVVARIAPGKIASLRADPSVSYVEEDGICEALGNVNSTKRGGNGGSGSTTTPPPQETPWGVTRVLQSTGDTGSGVKVAVIDTGIDLDHPDLPTIAANKLFISSGKATTADDDNGHGSHVAGTVAATNNSIGVVGVAPGATLIAAKVLDRRGSGTWSSVANGITWSADQGANIGNMSLGGSSSNTTLANACNYATGTKGMLLIAAAGNEGDGNTSTTELSYPAAYPNVLSVGATWDTDAIASFSNTNTDVEVSAPGVYIPSTYKSGGYATLSGTSMACPHAVGVAALFWAQQGVATATATSVRAALKANADPHSPATAYGAGIVEYNNPSK